MLNLRLTQFAESDDQQSERKTRNSGLAKPAIAFKDDLHTRLFLTSQARDLVAQLGEAG